MISKLEKYLNKYGKETLIIFPWRTSADEGTWQSIRSIKLFKKIEYNEFKMSIDYMRYLVDKKKILSKQKEIVSRCYTFPNDLAPNGNDDIPYQSKAA